MCHVAGPPERAHVAGGGASLAVEREGEARRVLEDVLGHLVAAERLRVLGDVRSDDRVVVLETGAEDVEVSARVRLCVCVCGCEGGAGEWREGEPGISAAGQRG